MEREVEREIKVQPKAQLKQQPSAPKPQALGPGGKKVPRGMETADAEEEEAKKAKKGKGKAAGPPAKVMTGAGSILGFFGKK